MHQAVQVAGPQALFLQEPHNAVDDRLARIVRGGEQLAGMHEIAARLACDNSNVTGIVDRLQARGLVTRRPSERDRRVKYIVPTPLGVEVRDAMRERMARPPAGIERLSVSEQRQLRDLLARAAGRRSPA